VGSIDFGGEPAYWYEKTMRDSERAGLAVRSRPAINRDERLIAREVRRHLDRVVIPRADAPRVVSTRPVRLCGACQQPFTRAEWRARRLWRVIYPRNGGRLELFRHVICPTVVGE
jgi:hypothetical protein